MKNLKERHHQLSTKTYNPVLSSFLQLYYSSFDHPCKLRVLNHLEEILGRKRIIAKIKSGFKMAVDQADLIQRCVLYERVWEPELTSFFIQEFKQNDIFLDIGSNIGYYTCLALSQGLKQVVAFEPDPLNCEILSLNLRLNQFNLEKVSVLQKALGSQTEHLKFYRSHVTNTGISGLQPCNAVSTFDVEVDTLDNLIQNKVIPAPTIIKMDVEGWEEQVLLGSLNVLKNFPPRLIIFEAFCDASKALINQELVQILRKYRFAITHSLFSEYGHNHVAQYDPSI